MELNNLEGRGRGSSFRRRALTLVGVSALTLSGVGAAVFGASQAFATNLTTQTYTIGTQATSGVTFSANNSVAGTSNVSYTVGFTMPSNFTSNSSQSVTVSGLPTATASGTANYILTDNATQTDYGVTSGGFSFSAAGVGSLNLPSTGISAGDQISVQLLGITNGSTIGNPYTVSVAAAGDLSGNAASFSLVTSPTATTPSLSVSNTAVSASNVTYTYSSWKPVATGGSPVTSLYVVATGNPTFPTATSDWTVSDTPSGSTTTSDLAISANGVTFTAANTTAIPPVPASYWKVALGAGVTVSAGDSIGVTVTGAQNGSTASTFYSEVTSAAPTAVPTSGGSYALGSSLGAVSLSVSPTTVNSTNAVYGLSFSVPTTYTYTTAAAATVTVGIKDSSAAVLATGPTTYAVLDATHPTDNSSGSVAAGSSAGTYTLPLGSSVQPGDSVTIDLYGATNNDAVSVSATVSTPDYSVPVTTNTVSYTAASSTSSPSVQVNPATLGAASNYTISGIKVGTAGVIAGQNVTLTFSNAETTLPVGSSGYSVKDLTTSSNVVLTSSSTSSAGEVATLTFAGAVNAGDELQISISGAINPSTASNSNTVAIGGTATLVASTTVAVAPTAAPNAATTMASGSLVQTGGTIYVNAGGVSFGIPTYADFVSISNGLGNPAVVQSATAPASTGTLASGTLVQVVGNPEVMVVGSNNTAYGFSTPSQFTSDGYSWSNVIQIPSLGNLTAGSAVAPSAASTMASGSLVQNGGTIYVIAGGVAFGIPTYSDFTTISAELGNPAVVQLSTAPSTTGTMASGTLVQMVGSPQVNVVTSTGTQVGFSTASEFLGDGYSWSNVIMIP